MGHGFIKQKLKEKKKMNENELEITVKLGNKKIPLTDISDETLLNIKKAQRKEKEPVFSVGKNHVVGKYDRVIMKITSGLFSFIKNAWVNGYSYIAFDKNGFKCYAGSEPYFGARDLLDEVNGNGQT